MSVKRMFDLFCCLCAIPVFGPLVIMISCLIKLDDGGPILFIQRRIGKNGDFFACFKFRTMAEGKVTRVGKWLRATGLDELAQTYNILVGDMSVVGPRPLTEFDVKRLGWQKHVFRNQMKPGMTGLAQLHAGQRALRSLACDKWYLVNQGLAVDCSIVIMSFCINIVGKRRFKKARAYQQKWLRQLG